jgi:ligand-binding sensor domain-containing protein
MTYNIAGFRICGFSINDIHLDDRDLWTGTSGGGLYRYQKKTGKMHRYDLGGSGNSINCMEEIFPGIFWMGLSEGGLFEFDVKTARFRNPLPEGKTANNIRWEQVNDILKDNNQVYVTTSYGIFVYDVKKKRLVQFSYPPNDSILYMNNWITSPVRLKNGEILAVSTFHGINRILYDAETGSLSLQCIVADSVLRSRNINLTQRCRLYQDIRGTLWLVEKTGLHRINPLSGEITSFKLFKDIDFPEAWSVMEDDRHNLWIGTLLDCAGSILKPETRTFPGRMACL